MAPPGMVVAIGRGIWSAVVELLFAVGRCLEPLVFGARRSARLLHRWWLPTSAAALAATLWILIPQEPAEPVPRPEEPKQQRAVPPRSQQTFASFLARQIEVARLRAQDEQARRAAKARLRRLRPLPEPYRGCARRAGMSTRAARRRCPRKIRAMIVPGKRTCLCVRGAVLGIPPDAVERETEISLEAVDVTTVEPDVTDILEPPISDRYVAQFSRKQTLSSVATLWVDLRTPTPGDAVGRMYSKSEDSGCRRGGPYSFMAPLDYDRGASQLGFVFTGFPERLSAIVRQ